MYLDPVDEGSGCLSVIPGSHHPDFRAMLGRLFESGCLDKSSMEIPGRLALPSFPGDIQVISRALWHSTWGDPAPRRQVHLSFYSRPSASQYGPMDWQTEYLLSLASGQPSWRNGHRLFSEELVKCAGDRARRKMQFFIDRGFQEEGRPPFSTEDIWYGAG
jgi:hypothetical protein